MSVTDSRCLSQIFCHIQSVFVPDSMCLFCLSVSFSNNLLDNSGLYFYLFIRDCHPDLSVRFQFVQDLNPTRKALWTPGGGGGGN